MLKNIIITAILTLCTVLGFSQSKFAIVKIKTSAICDECKKRIETNIGRETGVTKAELNLEQNILTVTYKPKKTSPDKIKIALTQLGYNADEMPRNAKAYDELPGCCKVKMH